MGYAFQVGCWVKYPSGHHLFLIMAKGKLEKALAKALKRKSGIIGILFMKINENRRKGR